VPNFDDVNGSEDIEVHVTVKDEDGLGRKLKTLLRKDGLTVIQKRLEAYLKELRTTAERAILLPTTKKHVTNTATVTANNKNSCTNNASSTGTKTTIATSTTARKSSGLQFPTKTYKHEYEFKCSALDAYLVFTDKQRVTAWSQSSDITLDAHKNGRFELFGKNVVGTFTLLEQSKKIAMEWRNKDWVEGHYSTATLTFEQGHDSTKVVLEQVGIPEKEYEKTCQGWNYNYFQKINAVFGYGASFGSF